MSTEPTWDRWRRVAVGLGVALLLPGALLAAFHCDEANVFRHVTEFGRGDFSAPGRPGLLWLLLSPALALGDPATIALFLRLTAVLASASTLWLVGRLARRATDAAGAAVAVALLATSMSWQAHAFEVRTDTYVLPLTLGVMLLLWRPTLRARDAVAIGLLMGAAGLFSQKTIYNAAAIGAGWAVLVGLRQAPRRLRAPLLSAGVALLCVALWYAALQAVNGEAGFVGTNLGQAAANAFEAPRPMMKKLASWSLAVARAPILYLGILPGLLVAWRSRRDDGQLLAVAAASAVMAATVFIHRGFFLYYIASFEPYLAILAGGGVVAVLRRLRSPAWAAVPALVVLAASAGPYLAMLETSNAEQIELMRDIREVAPQPMPYWDSVGLVPGYPETTFFLTRANRLRIRERMGPGALLTIARRRQPLIFVRNYMTREHYLEEVEDRWIWANFVPYRPNLYLRGGRVRVRAGEDQRATIDGSWPGPYTVWFWGGWTGRAEVNGRPVHHGDVIDVPRGDVELLAHAEHGSGQLWLIWGADRVPYAESVDDLTDRSLFPSLLRNRFQQYDKPGKRADLLTQAVDPRLRRLPEAERARRREAHRAWQRHFDAHMAAAQPEPPRRPAPPTGTDPDDQSPEAREDRALRGG